MPSPEDLCKILVVEDEWLIAMDIAMLVEDQGHTVIGPATTVQAALDMIDLHHVDAAFLDISLRAKQSFPIADTLRTRGVPFAFISAYGKENIPTELHGYDLLPKPVVPLMLGKQLRKMLGDK